MSSQTDIKLLKSALDLTPLSIMILKQVRDHEEKVFDYEIVMSNSAATDWKIRYDQNLLNEYNRVLETGSPFNKELLHVENGAKHWFNLRAVRVNGSELVVMLENISERKAVGEKINKQHKLLRQAEELSKGGSWEYDIASKEFLWSEGMYRLCGIEAGSFINPSIYKTLTIDEDQAGADRIINSIQENFMPVEEIIRISSEGLVKTIKVRTEALKNEFGDVVSMLGVDVDITQASLAEEKIARLNLELLFVNRKLEWLNSELKIFSQVASNDYDLTLRNLYTNLEFIITRDGNQLSNQSKANIRRAQTAIQKLKLLTEDIVAYTQFGKLGTETATVNLNEVLQSVLKDMDSRLKECDATVHAAELPVVNGHRSLLGLMFHNLIDYVIKYCEHKEPPLVSFKYNGIVNNPSGISGETIQMRYHQVTMSGNGHGFDPELAEKIFDIFFRLPNKNRNGGIGLAICRKVMTMHDGYILVEPAEKGAAFHCYFPAR